MSNDTETPPTHLKVGDEVFYDHGFKATLTGMVQSKSEAWWAVLEDVNGLFIVALDHINKINEVKPKFKIGQRVDYVLNPIPNLKCTVIGVSILCDKYYYTLGISEENAVTYITVTVEDDLMEFRPEHPSTTE